MIAFKLWYLGFVKTDEPRSLRSWWRYLDWRDKFQHVLALYYDAEFDQWVYYDWLPEGTIVTCIAEDEADAIIAELRWRGGKWLRYRGRPRSKAFPLSYGFLSCVPSIGGLVSAPRWIMTPTGLYRALLKKGAKPIFDSVPTAKDFKDGISVPEDTGNAA